MDITDLEIGFEKWRGYYLIARPLPAPKIKSLKALDFSTSSFISRI
jgi:hypothetical protein